MTAAVSLQTQDQPATNSADLEKLREMAFEYIRKQRPGDLPGMELTAGVNKLELEPPNPLETRYILKKVTGFAEALERAIPEGVRERAFFFEPPVLAPLAEHIVTHPMLAITALESLYKHLHLPAKETEKLQLLLEDTRYVVEAASRAILGMGHHDKFEFQHVLRALSSATSSAIKALPLLHSELAELPLPDPPPQFVNKGSGNPDETAATKTPFREMFAAFIAETGAFAAVPFRRLRVLLTNFWDSFHGMLGRFRDWGKLRTRTVRDFIERGTSRVWESVVDTVGPVYRASKIPVAYAAGVGVIGAAAYGVYLAIKAGHAIPVATIAGVVAAVSAGIYWREGIAEGLKSLWRYTVDKFGPAVWRSTVKVLSPVWRMILSGADAFGNAAERICRRLENSAPYRAIFARGHRSQSSGRFSSLSSDALSYLKKLVGRKNEKFGEIESRDDQLWRRLGVLNVHVLDDKGAAIIPLDRYLDNAGQNDLERSHAQELRNFLYPKKVFQGNERAEEQPLDFNEARIEIPVSPGPATLPLPPGYEITAIRFRTKKEKPLEDCFPLAVERCVFGSARIDVPLRAKSIVYFIKRSPLEIPQYQIARLYELLPDFQAYQGTQGQAFCAAMGYFNLKRQEQMKLLFEHQGRRGFSTTNDEFLRTFIDTAGSAAFETIGGLCLANKDALSYYSAAMFNSNGVPSVLLSGIVPSASGRCFETETGHSQAAVMTEQGVVISDLSQKAETSGELASTSLDVRERLGLLRRLRGLNYRSVFDYATQVRERLTTSGKKLTFFQELVRGIFDISKTDVPIFGRFYRDIALGKGRMQNDFDAVGQPPESRVIHALAAKLTCEGTIQRAREIGIAAPVFGFYREAPELPELRRQDQNLIPAEHSGLQDYQIREKVVAFAGEVLHGANFTPAACATALDWIGVRIPKQEAVMDYARDKGFGTISFNQYFHSSRPWEMLSLDELSRIFDQDVISTLNYEHASALLFGTLALPFAPIKGFRNEEVYRDSSPQALVKTSEIVLALVQRVNELNMPFSNREKEALAFLCAELGNLLIEKIKSNLPASQRESYQTAAQRYARTILLVTDIGQDKRVNFFFNLFMEGLNPRRQALVDFVRAVGGRELFGEMQTVDVKEKYVQSLASVAFATLRRRELQDHEINRWRQALEFFDAVGITADGQQDTSQVCRYFKRELAKLQRKGDIKIGYPEAEERPASFLASRLIDTGPIRYIRLLTLIEDYRLLKKGELKSVWPDISEESVFNLLYDQAKFRRNESSTGLEFSCSKYSATDPIPVEQLHNLSRAVLAVSPYFCAAISYNELRERGKHWAVPAFDAICSKFPQQWKVILDQFDSGKIQLLTNSILSKTYEGVTPREAYAGFLADAALRSRGDTEPAAAYVLRSLKQTCEARDPEGGERILALAHQMFAECEELGAPFSGLRWRAKMATIIGAGLLRENNMHALRTPPPKSNWLWDRLRPKRQEISANPVDQFFHYSMKIDPAVFQIARRQIEKGKTPEASAWQTLFKPEIYYNVNGLKKYLDHGRHRAQIIHARFRQPLAQFLYSQTGTVIVNAATGDFRGYREYGPGDSLRQVDWKRSVKDGDLSVRMREEEESRTLRLVYDLHLLRQDLKLDKARNDDKKANSRSSLRELFTILNLAEQENIQVDLVLYGRSHQVTLNGVVKRSTGSTRGHFSEASFIEILGRYLDGAERVLSAEETIYGNHGFPACNIFAAKDLPVMHGHLHFVAVSPHNARKSQEIMTRLRERKVLALRREEARNTESARRFG